MRELTTRALARLAREPNGKAHLLESDSAIALLLKLGHGEKEKEEAVRGNCLAAMIELGRDVPCRAALIAAGGVEQLVATAPGEVEALQPAALAALRGMMMAQPGLEQAIAAGAISAMISLLSAPAPAVREKVSRAPYPLTPPCSPSHPLHTPRAPSVHPLCTPYTLHTASRPMPHPLTGGAVPRCPHCGDQGEGGSPHGGRHRPARGSARERGGAGGRA